MLTRTGQIVKFVVTLSPPQGIDSRVAAEVRVHFWSSSGFPSSAESGFGAMTDIAALMVVSAPPERCSACVRRKSEGSMSCVAEVIQVTKSAAGVPMAFLSLIKQEGK